MSINQVKESFNFLFTDPSVTINTSPSGNTTSLTATMAGKTLFFTNCMVEEIFVFNFMYDKLYKVRYMAQNPPMSSKEKGLIDPLCSAVILNLFNKDEDDLYKQYGKPIKSEEYKKIWVLPSTTITISFKGKMATWSYFFSDYEKR